MTPQATGRTALALAIAIVTLGAAFGAAAAIPYSDSKFLQEAASHGMAEVQLAQLARGKAMRDEVRQFADRMITDHNKANEEVQALASTAGVKLPNGPDRKHEREYEKMKGLVGGDFDREYMKNMVKDHREDLKDFRHAAKAGPPESAVRDFAARSVPVLQEHLRMAQSTYDITAGPKRTKGRETGSTRK